MLHIGEDMVNATEMAYEYIKQKILEGIYKPSQRLVESQLAEEIGVSRNTIKNVLVRLEKENLVEIEKNKGAKIKSFTLEEVKNYLEIREVLEGLIAKSAAQHISDEAIKKLEQIILQMESYIKEEKFDDYSQLNKEFHNIIYQSSQNQQAVEMVMIIKTQLIRYHFRTILVPGRTNSSLQEHKKILEALKNRDPEKAEEVIMYHISHVREIVEKYYQFLI